MSLSRAKLFLAFAGLVGITTGLGAYDWRWGSIAAGALLIAAVVGREKG
ncbi:MAG: hypothetical protein ABIH03_15180 [Pseudomonadota bacterium]